jgi:hypothetical protein
LEVNVALSEREQRALSQQHDLFQRLSQKEDLDPDLREMYANQASLLLESAPPPAEPKPD